MSTHRLTAAARRDLLDAWRLARAWVAGPHAYPTAAAEGWLPALATELYRSWYTGYGSGALRAPSSEEGDGAAGPALVHRLRAAHAATTRYTGGWVVRAVGRGGAARLERGGERLHLLPPDYVHLARPAAPVRAGDVVSVTARRDWADATTGWWLTSGRGGVPTGAPMVRVYWNCPAEAAADLVAAVTRAAEEGAVPYAMKCPTSPAGFARVDSLVLYLSRDDWARGAVRAALRDVHGALGARLRPAAPRLALPLGRGVGLAEDPANGMSFGESRSRAVADGALAAMSAGLADEAAVLALLADRLRAGGVPPGHPHLRAGTPPELVPPW